MDSGISCEQDTKFKFNNSLDLSWPTKTEINSLIDFIKVILIRFLRKFQFTLTDYKSNNCKIGNWLNLFLQVVIQNKEIFSRLESDESSFT